jgi:RsiW-degrading membrane proteinase PrsW (M82 family)
MDHSGYWYRYLAARHDVYIYMSVVLIAVSLASVVSGYTLVKFQGLVRRSEKPNDFWQEVMIYFLMGIALWALYAFGPR